MARRAQAMQPNPAPDSGERRSADSWERSPRGRRGAASCQHGASAAEFVPTMPAGTSAIRGQCFVATGECVPKSRNGAHPPGVWRMQRGLLLFQSRTATPQHAWSRIVTNSRKSPAQSLLVAPRPQRLSLALSLTSKACNLQPVFPSTFQHDLLQVKR